MWWVNHWLVYKRLSLVLPVWFFLNRPFINELLYEIVTSFHIK